MKKSLREIITEIENYGVVASANKEPHNTVLIDSETLASWRHGLEELANAINRL